MDIDTLVKVTSRAWSLSILSAMHAGIPGRQAPLLNATGAGRTAFAQSIGHLIEIGLVERNPGHGHPLRPEFRLTEQGKSAASVAGKVMMAAPNGESEVLLRRTWTVPVLSVIRAPHYFGEIKQALPTITDRALSQSLKQLQARAWLTRTINTELHPPRARYQACAVGMQVGSAASAI